MKKYQSHKIVEASRIVAVNKVMLDEGHASDKVEVENEDGDKFTLPGGDRLPRVGDYVVRYPDSDGYTSWSPKDPFENGYTEVAEEETN